MKPFKVWCTYDLEKKYNYNDCYVRAAKLHDVKLPRPGFHLKTCTLLQHDYQW